MDSSPQDILINLEAVTDKNKDVPPQPIAAVMLPIFYKIIQEKYQKIEAQQPEPHSIFMSQKRIGFGIRVYQRDTLTLPGQKTYFAPYRLFYSEEALAEFLNRIDGM